MKNFKYTNNSYLSTQRQGASSQNNSNNNNQLALVFLKIIFINKGWNSSFFISWLYKARVAQTVENLPAVQETWVSSLGREDPLEKEMAYHFSVLAWKIPWTEEPGGL